MIKPGFTQKGLAQFFAKAEKNLDRIIIRELQKLGEECVNICRNLNTYQDDTGNLRASIAYELYVTKTPVAENYAPTVGKGSGNGEQGVDAAKTAITLLSESILDSDYQLILVAGMDYAEDVEMRNYAVLSPGQQHAELELPKIMARIMRSINAA